MARVETIVVGGGITAGTPFTLNAFVRVSATDPATLADGNIRQDTSSPPKVYIGEASLVSLATVLGGATANTNIGTSIVVGEAMDFKPGSNVAGSESVIIGVGGRGVLSGLAAAGTNMVVIGNAASNQSGSGGTIIGANAVVSGAGGVGNNCVLIGQGATITAGASQVVIGTSAAGSQSNAVVIGENAGSTGTNSTVVGGGASITANSCTVYGFGCTATAANVVNVGLSIIGSVANTGYFGHTNGLSNIVFGKGEAVAGGQAVVLRGSNASGTDNAAGAITLRAGISTGNAAQPAVNISLGDAVAGTGAALATAFNAIAVSNTTTDVTTQHDSVAASTKNVRIIMATAGTARSIIGTVGVAGGIVAGSAVGETVIRTQTQRLLFSLDGGTTLHADFTTAGVLELNVDRGFRMNNATSSAGAQGGTLTNAPTAGNPGFWLKVNIGGTNYAIPCWLG